MHIGPGKLQIQLRAQINKLQDLKPSSSSREVAIVEKRWHDSLIKWILDQSSKPPTKINNSSLFNGNKLKTSIKYQIDYEIVEKSIWQQLHNIFGGGPEIIRKFAFVTHNASCVIIDPIRLEMITIKGVTHKTCAYDWKLGDIKILLCKYISVNPNDHYFFSHNGGGIVDDKVTVGEYVKNNCTKINLKKFNNRNVDRTPNLLRATLPNKASTSQKLTNKTSLPSISNSSIYSYEIHSPKPTGFINLGNTCFFNAAMQCIVRVQPLINYIFSPDFDKSLNKTNSKGSGGAIALAFKELVFDLCSNQRPTFNPQKFRSILIRKYDKFANYGQHDSQEVVGAILDGLHEDLNRASNIFSKDKEKICSLNYMDSYKSKNDSIITDLFQGSFLNLIYCPVCKQKQCVHEPFMFLSLPVPNKRYYKVTLDECISDFCEIQTLDYQNTWQCPKCGVKVNAKMQILLDDLPEVLIIHLNRFNGTGLFLNKIETDVNYSKEIDISKYTNNKRGYYSLFGAIYHVGGIMGGHYTAAAIDQSTHQWYYFNDTQTSPIHPNIVHSSHAYVLFYRKHS